MIDTSVNWSKSNRNNVVLQNLSGSSYIHAKIRMNNPCEWTILSLSSHIPLFSQYFFQLHELDDKAYNTNLNS